MYVELYADELTGVRPLIGSMANLTFTARMDEKQMYEAMLAFAERIGSEQWAEMMEKLAKEAA